MSQIIKLVFSDYRYIFVAAIIFVGLLIPLLIISEYIFIDPILIGHIPDGTEFGFVLIVIVSGLSGLVLSMNVFRIKNLRASKKKMGGGLFGTIVGAAEGACSCGPIGFAVISTFGTVGGIATTFLTNYEIPIRLGAIALLIFTYYATVKSLKVECKLSN